MAPQSVSSKTNRPGNKGTFIAVVGGTSFGSPLEFGHGSVERAGSFQFETKAGPSPIIYEMVYKDVPFFYIPLYGLLELPAGESDGIYHVRTWAALYELGVTHVIGGATSGAIDPELDFNDIVLIDDFVEWRSERPNDALIASGHTRPGIFPNFESPLSPSIRSILIEEALLHKESLAYPGQVRTQGTFFQFAPGRFESPAEIRAMRALGADLTSMHQATCIIYARQFGIRYGSICAISNPAVGVRPFKFEQMQASVQTIAAFTVPVALETIRRIPGEAMAPEPSSTGEAFKGSYLDAEDKSTHG